MALVHLFESIIPAVLFLTAGGLIFAALLVFAEKKILDYGPCAITINGGKKRLTVKGGSSLLASLMENNIFIPSACGGRGSCSYCKVRVTEGGGVVTPVEDPYLSPEERRSAVRLSCQVKIRSDITIEIPDELFSVKRFKGVCAKKKHLTEDIIELSIALKEPETMDFTAGQYVQMESKEYQKREPVMRAYSISSPPSRNGYIELVVRLVPDGICTTWIFNHLKEGEALSLSGPYGQFRLSPADAPIICIAGGSGMAPIWSILQDMKEKGVQRKTTYFFGARSRSDLFYIDELTELAGRVSWFSFIPVLSNEPPDSDWNGERGLLMESISNHFPDLTGYEAYLCGSPGMIAACVKTLVENGIPVEKIFYDKFA